MTLMPFIPKDPERNVLQECRPRWERRTLQPPPPPAVYAWPPRLGNLGAAKATTFAHVRASSKPTAAQGLQDPFANPGRSPLPRAQAPTSRTPCAVPPYSPPGGSPLSPPETYRRSERPPANS